MVRGDNIVRSHWRSSVLCTPSPLLRPAFAYLAVVVSSYPCDLRGLHPLDKAVDRVHPAGSRRSRAWGRVIGSRWSIVRWKSVLIPCSSVSEEQRSWAGFADSEGPSALLVVCAKASKETPYGVTTNVAIPLSCAFLPLSRLSLLGLDRSLVKLFYLFWIYFVDSMAGGR